MPNLTRLRNNKIHVSAKDDDTTHNVSQTHNTKTQQTNEALIASLLKI